MTSKNQVSPVIRISRGERDASARATHLKAASKKYLETTIERKQMSTTTNFKRIALVAVAALGLGVLNSVPAQAAINADSVTLSSATASQSTAETYTATSAVVTVSFFGVGATTAAGDSMSITAALTGAPAGNTALPTLRLVETSSAFVDSTAATAKIIGDTITANTATIIQGRSPSVVTSAKFAVYLTNTGSGSNAPSVAGTYTVRIAPATVGISGALQGSVAQTLTITVAASPALDPKVAAATSKVFLQGPITGNQSGTPIADSSVAITSATPATTAASQAYLYILPSNAAGTTAALESLTVTTTIGGLGTNSAAVLGRSINVVGRGDSSTAVYIFPDGNSGVASISVTTASGVLLSTKSVRFFGAMAKLAGTAVTAIIAPSGTGTVRVASNDSADVLMSSLRSGEEIYAFSSDPTIATVPSTNLASGYVTDSAVVTVTGVKAGTATITFGNKSTLAASTITSAPVPVRVGTTAIASVTLAFDKTSYAPGEKAIITLTTLDATNLPTVPGTSVTLFEAGKGLNVDKPLLTGITTDTVAVVAITTDAATSATAGTVAGTKKYTVFMPTTSGPVTISATLAKASPLATAIQGTVITATASVTDSGSAALAAVTALATTVASLRTLIVTLTNLVLKIQKKVRA
jgi:trimeric autotransporter adhesin